MDATVDFSEDEINIYRYLEIYSVSRLKKLFFYDLFLHTKLFFNLEYSNILGNEEFLNILFFYILKKYYITYSLSFSIYIMFYVFKNFFYYVL